MKYALAVALSFVIGCQVVAGIDSRSPAADEDGGTPSNVDGGNGGGNGDASAPPTGAQSCAAAGAGTSMCGPAKESCCASPLVAAGAYTQQEGSVPSSVTISAFRLDRFEVTVGRFRAFVAAAASGWRPAAGSGKHTHLAGGAGLAKTSGGNESGWDSTWNANFPSTQSDWNGALSNCGTQAGTWTISPGASEEHPIACVTWFDAYAFCIWDGGFLPSEAEWGYTAAGGSEDRRYPWSDPPSSTDISCSLANYSDCGVVAKNVGSTSTAGDGKWAQADLAGNVSEWVLDTRAAFATTCNDCVQVDNTDRVHRGGGFRNTGGGVLRPTRESDVPTRRAIDLGFRCARTP